MLEIEYLHRTLNYSEALTRIEELASQTEKDGSDVSHRLRLLTAKALHFHKCRRPQKGLSLALRATTAAYRARIMPALWEATGALALAMVGIEQFDYAGELLDAVIYQVSKLLEGFEGRYMQFRFANLKTRRPLKRKMRRSWRSCRAPALMLR